MVLKLILLQHKMHMKLNIYGSLMILKIIRMIFKS